MADPALGVDALTEEHWAHIGICADCHEAVHGLVRLNGALTAALRSQPREELPAAVLATPAIPRARERAPIGTMLATAAVVVLAVGVAVAGSSWLGSRGVGIGPDPSSSASSSEMPSSAPTVPASSSATPSVEPTPSASAEPTAEPTPEPTPDILAAELRVGDLAAVVDEPLVVRTAPGTDPDSTITPDRLWIGQRVRLLDGPADVDGYRWWEVQVGEIRGWVADAEADGSAAWLKPIGDGRIWFWRHPGEAGAELTTELFSIRPDGSDEQDHGDPTAADLRTVLTCGYSTGALEWSHDGIGAAFSVAPGCDHELFLMTFDGVVRRLGDGGGPAWRPDGELIAFGPNPVYLVPPANGSGELLQVRPDGEPRRLTDSGADVQAGFPTWAPDGSRLAYHASLPTAGDFGDWTFRIYVADGEGSNADPIADGMFPEWSPDGRWIYYRVPTEDGSTVTLWRVRPDGTGAQELGEATDMEISPDGGRLVVARTGGVWTMAPDGSEASLAIPATAVDGFRWAPTGDALVVASNHAVESSIGISIVRLDGEAPAISSVTPQGHAPSWQPLVPLGIAN